MNIFKEYLLSVVLRLTLVLILTGGVVFYTSRQIAVNSEAVRTKRTLIPVLESALPKADDLFVYFNKLDKLAEKNGLAAQLAIGQQITSAEGGEPAGMVFRATI